MVDNVRIQKTVYNSTEFERVVDRTFSTFTQPTTQEDPDTPEELFRLYDKLYLSIDVEGETNSHEFLIRRSSELVNFERSTEEIQPLLDEIAQLRQQILLLNQQIVQTEITAT
jgi:hypothetical protein